MLGESLIRQLDTLGNTWRLCRTRSYKGPNGTYKYSFALTVWIDKGRWLKRGDNLDELVERMTKHLVKVSI